MMYEGVVWRQFRTEPGYDTRVHAPLLLTADGFINLNTKKAELVISCHLMAKDRQKLWLEAKK